MKTKFWIATLFVLSLALLSVQAFAQSDSCRPWALTDSTGVRWAGSLCPEGDTTPTPPPQETPTVRPTAGTTPTPVKTPTPGAPTAGIWISVEEVKALPQTGGWPAVLSAAGGTCTPDLANQDSSCNVTVLAQALAWARTGDEQYRTKVVAAISSINAGCDSQGGRALALGRELGAYVAGADLVDLLNHAPATHDVFVACLRKLLTKSFDGMTLPGCHERRGNNWGTHCGASRAAACAYIGDAACLDRTALVFHGWLGRREAYSGFTWGDLGWQCNASAPVGVNPVGCVKGGYDIGGAIPDDMRRGGAFQMPKPAQTGYACGGWSGAVAQAEILYRAGFAVYEWENKAILRGMEFLRRIGWQCTGDDAWLVAVINARYGTNYPVDGNSPGKGFGWTQWTHAGVVAVADVIAVDDTRQVATGESLGDLQDEIEYQAQFGWTPTGEMYMLDGGEDGELYAQDMERK